MERDPRSRKCGAERDYNNDCAHNILGNVSYMNASQDRREPVGDYRKLCRLKWNNHEVIMEDAVFIYL
jgi:hypothetical protein